MKFKAFLKVNKYRNKKVIVNGIKFDSKKEANTYLYLLSLLDQKKIIKLQTQVKFTLIPKTDKFRECSYYADFVITYPDNTISVVDTKSKITRVNPVYRIKKKLMYWLKQIKIEEK